MVFLNKYGDWIAAIIIAFILCGSLPFKFSGHPMPTHIFNVVGEFLGLDFFKAYGAIIIGIAELIASILLLIPKTRAFGGILTMGIMAGAIFFHLFTPLGVTVEYVVNGEIMSDGSLFYTAIIAFILGTLIAYRNRSRLALVGNHFK
ncbi:hypothetical protein [Kordiimonas pumila]|uniref:DoxX family protein n=1 Tax=Kordiimonas pumila TaxID=2161677 RepID=A0ABV7D6D6_9PROT|nr:hypothetical protein [Kordiimonas pumila]